MFFNGKRAIAGLVGLAALIVSGCSVRIGEKPAASTQVQLGGVETACLSGAAKTIDRYWSGTVSDREISEVWHCASSSLRLFTERTRGETPGVYTSAELKKFLEHYFLTKGSVIPPALFDEIMVLKTALLGGTKERLTEHELAQARNLMDVLSAESVRLRPFMPLTPSRVQAMSVAELDMAIETMRISASNLGALLEGSGAPYPIEHMVKLLAEFQAYSRSEDIQSISSRLRRHLPFVGQVKGIFIAPGTDRIEGKDWKLLLGTAVDAYGTALRAIYAMKHHPSMCYGEGRAEMMRLARELYTLLDQSLERHPGGMIPFEELDALVDAVDPRQLSFGRITMTKDSIKWTLRPVFQRGLGRGIPGPEGRDARGITRPALKRAMELAEIWSAGQDYLERAFTKAASDLGRSDALVQSFAPEALRFRAEDLYTEAELEANPVVREVAQQMAVMTQSIPLYQPGDREIFFFPGDPKHAQHTFFGLTQLNWLYLTGRVLPEAYAEDPERIIKNPSVNRKEFEHFYNDLMPLGVELKIFNPFQDPDKPTVPQKRFLESNLFMFHADQDSKLLNVQETAETMAFTLSAKMLSVRTHERIAALCGKSEQDAEDFWGAKFIPASCYREKFFADIEKVYDHMPKLLEYYRGLDSHDRTRFQCYLQDAGRPNGNVDAEFASPDSEGLSGIAQYLEAVFARYDVDQNGTLDNAEADMAYEKVFRNALKEASCKIKCMEDDSELKPLFKYVLWKGKIPEWTGGFPTSWREWKDLGRLAKAKFGSINIAADRTRLLQILAIFAKQKGQANPCAALEN